jgi:hypothetical protein
VASSVFGELLFGAGVFGSTEEGPEPKTPALTVEFDIREVGSVPLTVQFDIGGLGPRTFPPLTVRFDIHQSANPPLTVTFDILGDIVSRRLISDIQGPVAEVDLT